MPRSYKICNLRVIESDKFSSKPYFFDKQQHMEIVDRPASTSIYLAGDSVRFEDFTKYMIEHEIEEKTIGRIHGQTFTAYIRTGYIDGFVSKKLNIVLFSGKKRDVLDFCKMDKNIDEFKFNTTKIDMKKLLALLPNVRGVWFNFPTGQITASALMGSHLDNTDDFKHFKNTGEISTLSFHYEMDGNMHPVMITEDGTVVVQGKYKERAEEINLVLSVKNNLLNNILEEIINK